MNKQEQHEQHDLLIRLDERSRNTWRMVEKIEKHQVEQNGSLQKIVDRVDNHEFFIQTFMKVIRIAGPLIVLGFLAWLGIKIPGWW